MLRNPETFWDNRHSAGGWFRSGGDVALSEHDNGVFYHTRLGQLLALLINAGIYPEGRRLLDAGCGKGWFAFQYARLGYEVVGLDTSRNALASAPKHPRIAYHLCDLAAFEPVPTFDAVLSVDVLFHILDDKKWCASVRNLARSVKINGCLIISDHCNEDKYNISNYIFHRTIYDYLDVLSPHGFNLELEIPFDFPGNQNRFYFFRKPASTLDLMVYE